jgi:hypothetical protein
MHPVNPRHAEVRPLPYPYLAALALSNDSDFCSMELFEQFMRFVNGTRRTAFGEGLGLELSASLFFYSPPGRQFSYYDGLDAAAPPGPNASRLDEYLRAGWIDTNHAYGDFDGAGGFVRAHAERALERLHTLGVRLPAYTNHGDFRNVQCLGAEAPHHEGDRRDSPAYHSDLLLRSGTRYFSSSSHISGDVSFEGHAAPWPEPGKPSWFARIAPRNPAPLLTPVELRDSGRMVAFNRRRGTAFNAPNLSSLAYQVGSIPLERLYRERAVVVLYQHLGVLHRSGRKCTSATVEAVRAMPHLLAPFRLMKRESDEGRLWVPAVHRLLTYVEMIGNVEIRKEAEQFDIDSKGLVGDPRRYFAGLTLYCHPRVEPRVRCRGIELPLRHNGPDESGRYSVSLPFPPLPDIW